MIFPRTVAVLALCISCYAWSAQDDLVMLNFVNADIETVVKAISEMTGRNFILDPRVKGTVNIISSRAVPRRLSYQIMLDSLRLQGFTAVEAKGVTKIVPEADAKLHAGIAKRREEGDQLVTKVFVLKNTSVNQLLPVIRPIVSPNNTVSSLPQASALVVTDYADNIRRIESIIDTVEHSAAGDYAILPIRYGAAAELAGMLNKLMQDTANADAGKVTIVPDGRANLLMVRADSPGKLARVKSLLRVLDQPSQAGANVRVVYLKNADAARVAQTLRTLLSSEAGLLSASSRALPGVSATSSTLGNNSTGTPPANNPASPTPGATGADGQSGAPGTAGSMIQADTPNNALILNVPDTMYQNLRNVIDLLDRRRAQVYVETLVMEVSANRLVDFGVQWQSLSGINSDKPTVIGSSVFPSGPSGAGGIASTAQNGVGSLVSVANQGGLTIGVVNGTINLPGIGQVLNLGLLARALEEEAQGNVISNPNLMATDNEKAKIEIGQEIPIITGSYTNGNTSTTTNATNSSTVTPFNTYDRKKVGFILELTPQISEGGSIRMRIHQEASTVESTTLTNPSGPTTNFRTIDTTVTVDDGGIIAIGGLISEDIGEKEEKVPLLGDIPVLGWLFKHQRKRREKRNLLVFLKPKIVRDDLGAQTIAEDRYRYIIGETDKAQAKQKLALDPKVAIDSVPTGIKPLMDEMRPVIDGMTAPNKKQTEQSIIDKTPLGTGGGTPPPGATSIPTDLPEPTKKVSSATP